MPGVRDSYRSRVYAAEGAARLPKISVSDLWHLRSRVLKSTWWQKHERTPVFATTLTAGGKRWRTGGCLDTQDTGSMLYRPNPQLRMLHALAHYTVEYGDETQLHGPEFAKAYLAIVQRFIGREAKDDLQVQFATHKVKTRTWSPEAREKARQRFAERDLKSMLDELQ